MASPQAVVSDLGKLRTEQRVFRTDQAGRFGCKQAVVVCGLPSGVLIQKQIDPVVPVGKIV